MSSDQTLELMTPATAAEQPVKPEFETDTHGDANAVPPEFSEIALADRFVTLHGVSWRYCATLGKWLEWTGKVWRADQTMHAYDLARKVCAVASEDLHRLLIEKGNDEKARRSAATIATASVVAAVERLAKANRKQVVTVQQLDADPWLLNTQNGLIYLRTGQRRTHDAAAYCTRITGAGIGERCDAWHGFLRDVTDGDEDLIEFLQRIAGYSLTGDVSEHALFFAHGPGGNGKSVFINALAAAMGDYALTVPMDAFVASHNDRHPTDLAMLRGARLAVASETEEGRRWAESKIKALTGGDPITARFMRQDFFTFNPQFKLFIVGNHKPSIRNVDTAMRRRLHLLPFTFTPKHPDNTLPARLAAEADGILKWALDGCAKWMKEGLNVPERVRSATSDYFESEDAIGRWLEERTELHPRYEAMIETTILFEDWNCWAEHAGEYVGSQKRFVENLSQRGAVPTKHPRSRRSGFRGISLLPSPQ